MHSAVKKEHLKSVHTITCGAAPLGPLDEEKLITKIGKSCLLNQGMVLVVCQGHF